MTRSLKSQHLSQMNPESQLDLVQATKVLRYHTLVTSTGTNVLMPITQIAKILKLSEYKIRRLLLAVAGDAKISRKRPRSRQLSREHE